MSPWGCFEPSDPEQEERPMDSERELKCLAAVWALKGILTPAGFSDFKLHGDLLVRTQGFLQARTQKGPCRLLMLEYSLLAANEWYDQSIGTMKRNGALKSARQSTFIEIYRKPRTNMNWKILHQRTWLNLISTIILLVGLGSSVLIYQSVGNDPYGPLDFENSKLYRHNLEVYGGKFSVIMDDFRRWFLGLWQGKSLALIIAGTTIIISFGVFYAANHLAQPSKPDAHNENDHD